jgi:hypothetical protein
MNLEIFDLIGIFGAMSLVFAFYMASTGGWKGISFKYNLANLVGSISLGVYGLSKSAYVFVALNSVWGLIALKQIIFSANKK